jgi:hypothetical protein
MSESLHPEINPFPVWTFESRVLTRTGSHQYCRHFSYLLADLTFITRWKGIFESYEVIAKATGVSVRTAKLLKRF